jgi:hypothetical protein
MSRLFFCSECDLEAFTTDVGINHHGEPDNIDHDADGDHVALDPEQQENPT